jgi:hypothetical protein
MRFFRLNHVGFPTSNGATSFSFLTTVSRDLIKFPRTTATDGLIVARALH